MCNYSEVELSHMVIFDRDSIVYAAGREHDHVRIFIVNEHTGNVYSRNGRADSWEEIWGSDRASVVARVISARNYRNIPIYRIKERFADSAYSHQS
jgi:hypothetical protein